MKNTELVKLVADKSNVSQKDVEMVIRSFVEVIKENVMEDEVPLIGVGKFVAKDREAREFRNPQDGTVIKSPKCSVPSFKMSKVFRDSIKTID